MERIAAISNQLAGKRIWFLYWCGLLQLADVMTFSFVANKSILDKNPDDVVIVDAVRTPIAKANRGGYKDMLAEELLAVVLKALLDRNPKLSPTLIEDIQVGSVTGELGGSHKANRMAQITAGVPWTASMATTNRQCASGLQACQNIAAEIRSGQIEIGIGAGAESMTIGYKNRNMPTVVSPALNQHPVAKEMLMPMGLTSENVAKEYGVTRREQDIYAERSNRLAAKAQAEGWFDEEIVPVTASIKDKDGKQKALVVSKDEGVRGDTTLESLSKLKPSFTKDGTTTAGNASQLSDGAAAVLMMKRSTAERLGLQIKGKFIAYAFASVPPRVMGIGPAFAVPKALSLAGISIKDVDIFEINEAFASQLAYCARELGIPQEKVNPSGGAIALGHPVGMTGARQIATLLGGLKRSGGKIGVTTMCAGTGMGAASVIVRE
ncbi:hypothetical protein SmJEL517_g03608 [Synchytrium microbalum]|uniref:acetyl-CoA C-acyltransferase n=1 Tax=Synchytrium microbalum TaxID=1806994 RepID=A0A507C2D6_9FUNG|nr:uncharacterized protein SmJEL517_g03608 [Synchytrium microbalum]TPX33518.1 hypothetical protein SmJEL517_g03608 [Synchytrium microbalum]